MTRDELIKCGCWFTDTGELVKDDIDLNAFAQLVAEKEREACALVADEWSGHFQANAIAQAIRDRGSV